MRKFIYNGREVIAEENGKRDVRDVAGRQLAFAKLEIKEFDEKTRRFKGVATTATPDRMDDIVEADGAMYKLPIPFLYQHDSAKPIGWIDRAKQVGKRWDVEGFVETPAADAPATIVERLNVAWYELKTKLVRGLSIGFNPKEWSFIEQTGGIRWLKWEWLELSLVTIPANAEATITTIKSFATSQRAASGRSSASGNPPARAGAAASTPPKGIAMKTYTQESLAALQESRRTKAARMAELDQMKANEQRGYTTEERAEVGALNAEILDLDDDIMVTERHVSNIAAARPVDQQRGQSAHIRRFKDVEPKFKGEEGLKRVMCQLHSALDVKTGHAMRSPAQVAEARYGKSNPSLVAIMKTNEIAGAGSGSGEALAELVAVDNRYTGDFIEYLYGLTVFDRLPLREVPANVAIKGIDGAYTGYFVGESKPIPMSQASASSVSTSPLKVAALTVLSNELIRDSSPSALGIAGDGLRSAIAQVVDTKFFSVDVVSAGVSPAGILNGVSIGATNGADAESIKTDIKALFAPFIAAKNAQGFVWVMTPTTALALSLMQNALGQTAFPGVTPQGGTFVGYPVYTGDNIGTGDVILLQPKEIWKIGDLGVTVSISNETMIEQSSAPTGMTDTPAAASQYMTSMFQEESTAIKVVRPINWGKRRSTAVAYIGNAAWGAEQS